MKENKSKKQVIIEESAVLFNKIGYSATSMKDIAKRVGIKAASLYNHIGSKQEILEVLLLTIANKFYNGIKDVNKSSYSSNDKLREVIKMHIRIATEDQNITALIIQDWKHLEEPRLSEFVKIRNDYIEVFRDVIKQGMEKGELRFSNLEITLNIILSSLRWIYDSELYDGSGFIGITELEKTILDIIFNGIDIKA